MGNEYKLALITGATEGVGKATAIQLAEKGYNIVMMARNKIKAEQALKEIKEKTGNPMGDFIIGDLASFKQVRAVAEQFNNKYKKLDVLINNAGLWSGKKSVTEDGFEQTFQVNYLSHFLLTHLLLPKIKLSEQGRIINVSSMGHKFATFDPANFNGENRYSSAMQYANSKLGNIYFTYSLAEKLKGTNVTVNALHPGVVKSRIYADNAKGLMKPLISISYLFMITNEQGAATSVFLASDPGVSKISGKYFDKCKEKTTARLTYNGKNQQVLWDYSTERCGLKL